MNSEAIYPSKDDKTTTTKDKSYPLLIQVWHLLRRAVVFFTLFSLVIVFLFVVGGYQQLGDDSLFLVLRVEAMSCALLIILSIMLFIINTILAITNKKTEKDKESAPHGNGYIAIAFSFFLSILSFLLSLSLLFASLIVRFASNGL